MGKFEIALQQLELAQRELVAANPSDFESLERLGKNRGAAINAILELVEDTEPSIDQLERLKRIHLGGILSVERIRGARQAFREELARLSQQGQLLAGYQIGSKSEASSGPDSGSNGGPATPS